jgi:hypothetical protein
MRPSIAHARQEVSVVAWLVPVALFWTLSALYLGGAAIRIEGGGGAQHMGGLLVLFVAYLVVYGILRLVLSGLAGAVIGGIVVPAVLTSMALPFLAKLTFRLFGVSIGAMHGGAPAA